MTGSAGGSSLQAGASSQSPWGDPVSGLGAGSEGHRGGGSSVLGAPGATSDPAPGGCPSPQRPSPPPSPSAGEGTAPTREKRRCGVGGPAASSALTPLSPPERWTALPDFPDHDKWGFSLAALNSSVYVTGEARRPPPRAAAARPPAAVRTPTRPRGQLPLARWDPAAQSRPFRSSLA